MIVDLQNNLTQHSLKLQKQLFLLKVKNVCEQKYFFDKNEIENQRREF